MMLLNNTLCINLAMFILASSIANNNIELQGIGLTLVFFLGFYSVGCSAASMDRRAEITDINLPPWRRRVLFIYQGNPFRRKTVFFQTTLVIATPTALVLFLVPPSNFVGALALSVYIVIVFVLTVVCDIRTRRKIPKKKQQ